MTVKYITGDVFAAFLPGTVLVHGCNAQHVMGSGVAAIVRECYPEAYQAYMDTPTLALGSIIPVTVDGNKILVNAITQEFYGRSGGPYASLEAIKQAMTHVRNVFPDMKIIIPEIGCGLGGLKTTDVFPMLEELFNDDQVLEVYSL